MTLAPSCGVSGFNSFYPSDIQMALLKVRASSINGAATVQAHVYGLTNSNWSQNSVTWSNAPNLAQGVPAGSNYINNFVLGTGDSAQMVGEPVAGSTAADYLIDVTQFLRNWSGQNVSFLIARERRFFGNEQNGDGIAITSQEGDAANGPRLLLVPNTGRSSVVPPFIYVQPASQTVSAGANATFTVWAGGASPLAFQWRFNATNILVGATNASLTLTNVQAANAANYSVVVTNQGGAVTSSIAPLVVQSVVALPLLAYDAFNYLAGSVLENQGGWVTNSASAGDTIEAGSLPIPGLAAATGNRLTWGGPSLSLRLPLSTVMTTGAVYFSFALRIDSLGSSFNSVGTLAGFTTGTGTAFGTKINIRTNGTGGFNLGTSKGSGTTFGGWGPADYSVGQTIFVVGRYTFFGANGTDDQSDLWLNPSTGTFGLSAPPPTVAAVGSGGTDLTQIDRFFFRSGGSSSSPSKIVTDELRVGRTWADVTPLPPPKLNILFTGSSIALSWPTNYPDHFLQTASALTAPVSWSPVFGAPLTSGTNYLVTLDPTNAVRFFRLSN